MSNDSPVAPAPHGETGAESAAAIAARDAAIAECEALKIELSVVKAKLGEVEEENLRLRVLGTKLNIQLQAAITANQPERSGT